MAHKGVPNTWENWQNKLNTLLIYKNLNSHLFILWLNIICVQLETCDAYFSGIMLIFADELIKQGLIMKTSSAAISTICGYTNEQFHMVRRHLEGKHSVGSGYPCPVCKFKSKTEDTRRRHVRRLHKKIFSVAELREIDEKGITYAWESGHNKYHLQNLVMTIHFICNVSRGKSFNARTVLTSWDRLIQE